MENKNYELAKGYLVQIGVYVRQDRALIEGYKALYKKYLHHKQAIHNTSQLENLEGLEARLWTSKTQ